MNTLWHLSLYLLLTLTFIACGPTLTTPPTPPAIIPQPVAVSETEGWFEINKTTTIGIENEFQKKIADDFSEHFQTVTGWKPQVIKSSTADILFTIKETIAAEGYELDVTPERIIISASANAGFFYALQSIRQLLPTAFAGSTLSNNTRWTIPAVQIKDKPRFGWRGFMLDVSRHFYSVEQVKTILDHMATLKFNTFHWHLTDDQGWRIESKLYPKLTEIGAWRVDYNDHDWNHNRWWGRPVATSEDKATYGGFYTQEEIREIIDYATERYITILPEIDVPGHAQAIIASYPEYACHPGPYYVATGGVYKDNTLCPGKEETFEFLENILNEVMDLFPSKYIHIGGDECNKEAWKVDPDCQHRIKEEGLENEQELQSYFIRRVEKIINARDRILIGWDEILEGGLAPNATVMSWRGEAGGIAAAKEGHQVIMTPNKYSYLDLKQGHTDHEPNLGYSQCLLSTSYNYNPVPESLAGQPDLILGIEGNLWTESLPEWDQVTYMTFPRLFAIAENAWSTQTSQDWNNFVTRLYPQLKRLDAQEIKYAKSAFNVWIGHKGSKKEIIIDLHTEAEGLKIHYTLDGSEPDTSDFVYQTPFELKETAMVQAAAFLNNQRVGDITQKQFHVHSAAEAIVHYHTNFSKSKNGGGTTALTDLNYGSNWVVDSLWQGFQSPDVEFDIKFKKEMEVSNVQINFLQIAISGIYMPEQIKLMGTKDGDTYFPLASSSLLEYCHVQGRYIHKEKIEFGKQKLNGIKAQLKAVNPIPTGHNRAGDLSKIYMDEVIVY